MTIAADPLERRPHFIEIRSGVCQPALRRIGIRHHGGQWLVDFVGDRRRHGAETVHARHPHEFGPRCRKCILGPLALGDVLHHSEHERLLRRSVRNRENVKLNPDQRAVLAAQLLDHLEVLPFALPQLLEQHFIHFTLAGHADIQGRELPQLVIGVADHPLIGRIGGDEAVVLIDEGDAEDRVLDHRAPPVLALLQGSFGTLPPKELDQQCCDQRGLKGDHSNRREDQRLVLRPQCRRLRENPQSQVGGRAPLGAARRASDTKHQCNREDWQRRRSNGQRHDMHHLR
jgi:hypothetical protein